MSKKSIKTIAVDKPVKKQEPKIHFNKYVNKYVISNKYELAFLKGSFKPTDMHTIKEWDILVELQLNKKLV